MSKDIAGIQYALDEFKAAICPPPRHYSDIVSVNLEVYIIWKYMANMF
jgi:hypothetical protein